MKKKVAKKSAPYDAVKRASRAIKAELKGLNKILKERFTTLTCPKCSKSEMWDEQLLEKSTHFECPSCGNVATISEGERIWLLAAYDPPTAKPEGWDDGVVDIEDMLKYLAEILELSYVNNHRVSISWGNDQDGFFELLFYQLENDKQFSERKARTKARLERKKEEEEKHKADVEKMQRALYESLKKKYEK